MNLDPAKLLVILVIGLLVLGPERLPKVARQLGRLWQDFTAARDRLVDEIKDQIPDLPSSRSFRSVLVDPLSIVRPEVAKDSLEEVSGPAATDDNDSNAAWTAHRRGPRGPSSTQTRDFADPTMN